MLRKIDAPETVEQEQDAVDPFAADADSDAAQELSALHVVGSVAPAQAEAVAVILPDGQRVPFDAFDWQGLADDVITLRIYQPNSSEFLSEYQAVRAVVAVYRNEFINRLRSELKSRRTAQWKQETFERLKREFDTMDSK